MRPLFIVGHHDREHLRRRSHAHALPNLTGDMFVGGASERLVVHALDEQFLEHLFKVRGKVLEGVGPRRLGHLVRVRGRGSDLVEEELIGRGEVGAEPFVELFDQGGQLDCIILGPGGADIGRPFEGIGLAVTEIDGTLADLAKSVTSSGVTMPASTIGLRIQASLIS